MKKLIFAAVSRNYFNLPIWVAKHCGLLADEGLDVTIELYEGVDEVTNRLRDGRAQLGYGIAEHVVLDSEAGGFLEIVGGNVNRPPFSLVAGKNIRTFEDLRDKTVGVSSIEAGSSSLVSFSPPADFGIRVTTRCGRSVRSWRGGKCCSRARSMRARRGRR